MVSYNKEEKSFFLIKKKTNLLIGVFLISERSDHNRRLGWDPLRWPATVWQRLRGLLVQLLTKYTWIGKSWKTDYYYRKERKKDVIAMLLLLAVAENRVLTNKFSPKQFLGSKD